MKTVQPPLDATATGAAGVAPATRRRALVGLGLVGGGAALAAATLTHGAAEPTPASAQTPVAPERGGGYHLSERAKRYYQSARV